MKKALLLGFALLMISSAVCAQLPPTGYIGLYADNAYSVWCVNTPDPPPTRYPIEMWVWCLPSDRGLMCAEFAVVYPDPSIVIQSTVTNNDSICVALGTLADGLSICFCNCQWDWNWLCHQTLWVAPGTKAYIDIVVHPDPYILDIQFANCDSGLPIFPAIEYTHLYLNYDPSEPECGETDTKDATWGAIKNLYRE